MKSVSKAIAGGVGASIAKIVVFLILHYFPGMDQGIRDAVEYLVYTGVTVGLVYFAPANIPSSPPPPSTE